MSRIVAFSEAKKLLITFNTRDISNTQSFSSHRRRSPENLIYLQNFLLHRMQNAMTFRCHPIS